ncbi:MAG: TlpA disulfide reductase family protein, partial [Acidimicrobiales bacterium]|nr:TlpA disulfide reductase family protein [Acidimicrobiales bacterium]
MRAAYEKYRDEGFEVLSVSVREDDAAVEGFVERYGLEYPFLLDRDGSVSLDYEVTSTPTTYFVSP